MYLNRTQKSSTPVSLWMGAALGGLITLVSVTGGSEEGHRPPELSAIAVQSDFGIVATGSPEATEAAVAILERGGNAIDAAVTAALVLGVSDLDASGIGGGTYMLLRLANGYATAIDGTPRAPARLDLEAFSRLTAQNLEYGIEFIAVPTTLAVLQLALDRYGSIAMADALQPAIDVAENGYRMSPIQFIWTEEYHGEILEASSHIPFIAMEDGETINQVGDLVCRPELAHTLRRLAREGIQSFYRGSIADEIEADMVRNGGFLRKSDLAAVRIREKRPLRTTYRDREVITFPRPGGGSALVAALNILETYPSVFLATDSTERMNIFGEVVRIAHAESALSSVRAGHPFSVVDSYNDKDLARRQAKMITPGSVIPEIVLAPEVDPNCLPSTDSTTHLSVIDQWGNTVSLTQSLAKSFGAKYVTPGLGFPYNSFLVGFNAVDPGCPGFLRPRSPCGSDMAPTIVVRDGRQVLALGSPGSSRIPSILSNVISNLVDREWSLEKAINHPRVVWGGTSRRRLHLEIVDPITDADVETLTGYGYEGITVIRFPHDRPADMADLGGVNVVSFDLQSGRFTGVIDGRRGGLALGPRAVAEVDHPLQDPGAD